MGVGGSDRATDGERLAAKIGALRIFDAADGRMRQGLSDVGGAVLAIPQFTLYADVRHGRRPEFTAAAPPDVGRRLFDGFCGVLRGLGVVVAQGRFGASMHVTIEAEGPVTIALSTDGWREAEIGGSS